MDQILFLALLLLTFGVFFFPLKSKYYYSLIILATGIIVTSIWGIKALGMPPESDVLTIDFSPTGLPLLLVADRLSAFFMLVINFTVLTGFVYARGYLRPYMESGNSIRFSLHYLAYLWLYLSMILVVMLRDGLPFLIAWEVMAISSFLLVTFEASDTSIMKTGISYLIQMHAGMFFLLIAFLILERETGVMSFDSLSSYFLTHKNLGLFMLFFVGFGIKAGFVPLHTWLPQAHPAAPSHVSGVMSGVMIKMGIYGIIRVLTSVQHDLLLIGLIILAVSLLSGILGIMMAVVQKDLKKMLAYSSLENIGIIGTGTGLGVIGTATGNNILTLLGFSGSLLHILNHSLFKSILFFSAGSVYQATHSRNIEQQGGLMKRMPATALLFLVGSLAICGLPPFNGFISEYLIYLGMFKSLSAANLQQSIVILASITGLCLIGGLAVFGFTRAFGIVFLGEPRSEKASVATERERTMIFPQIAGAFLILLIGLGSPLVVKPVMTMVSGMFLHGVPLPALENTLANLSEISLISGIFILTVSGLLLWRSFHLRAHPVSSGPTWGCGYTVASPKIQYTGASYAYNYNHLAKPVLNTKKEMKEISEKEVFPEKRSFAFRSEDIFKTVLIDKPSGFVAGILKKIAMMQTGLIQHYILYAFVYMLIVFLLTYLNLI